MLGNRETMAINIKRFMEEKGVNSSDVCKALGFKQNTFSNWINAKIYPRIDKIEKMANYFGVTKADLVEEHLTALDGNCTVQLTPEEHRLIIEFRKASEMDQQTIRRMLSYASALNTKEVPHENH